MTVQNQDNATDTQKNNAKEENFRAQEKALKDHYEKQIQYQKSENERLARELEEKNRLASQAAPRDDDDDDDDEPYVDKKKLKKKFNQFEQQTQKKTQNEIQNAIQNAIKEDRQERWLEEHKDFVSVMQNAEKLHHRNPQLARNILAMPDTFERQQLVYNTIKELALDKDPQKAPSIQEKIDANRRSPYYQPSGMATAPYAGPEADFSDAGQKGAYDRMKGLQKRLRIS